jgi:hypothetical protein
MTLGRLEFAVHVTGDFVDEQICVYLSSPAVLDDHPGCWTCLAGWTGRLALERPAFGATPLQAISVALPLLESLLHLRFANAEFFVDGRPFLLTSAEG